MRPRNPSPSRRDEIRTAARTLFITQGFANTTTDAIAAAASVSKQTIYACYPSKEEILADVLVHFVEGFDSAAILHDARSVDDIPSLRRRLQELGERMIASLMQPDYLALARVIIGEAPRFPQLGAQLEKSVPDRVLGSVAATLEEARVAGFVDVPNIDVAGRCFVGGLLTYVLLDGLLSPATEPKRPPATVIAAIVEHTLRAVVPSSEQGSGE